MNDSLAATSRRNFEIPFHLININNYTQHQPIVKKKLNQRLIFSYKNDICWINYRTLVDINSHASEWVSVCVWICWKRNSTNSDQAKRKLSCNHIHSFFMYRHVYIVRVMFKLNETIENDVLNEREKKQHKLEEEREKKTMSNRKLTMKNVLLFTSWD